MTNDLRRVRRRITVEGDWEEAGSPGYWVLRGLGDDLIATVGPAAHPTITVIPDPLPSTPGTHIIATVTRGPEWEPVEAVLKLGPEGGWFSAGAIHGNFQHRPNMISDWREIVLR